MNATAIRRRKLAALAIFLVCTGTGVYLVLLPGFATLIAGLMLVGGGLGGIQWLIDLNRQP